MMAIYHQNSSPSSLCPEEQLSLVGYTCEGLTYPAACCVSSGVFTKHTFSLLAYMQRNVI